jgi:uncharacterized membrane protein (UPF0136 family)
LCILYGCSVPVVLRKFGIENITETWERLPHQRNQDDKTELALGNSIALLGSAVPRIIKTGGRASVSIALGATGALVTYYYQKEKVREFSYGV